MTYDRPMWPPGAEITAQAFDAYAAWERVRDPHMECDALELVDEYASLQMPLLLTSAKPK